MRVRDGTGKAKTQSYPRAKPVLQGVYEQWQKDVYDEEKKTLSDRRNGN
jgi:hypothetical protein